MNHEKPRRHKPRQARQQSAPVSQGHQIKASQSHARAQDETPKKQKRGVPRNRSFLHRPPKSAEKHQPEGNASEQSQYQRGHLIHYVHPPAPFEFPSVPAPASGRHSNSPEPTRW